MKTCNLVAKSLRFLLLWALVSACAHSLVVVTIPPGAAVEAGGRSLGVTPLVIERADLAARTGRLSTLKLKRDGYQAFTVVLGPDSSIDRLAVNLTIFQDKTPTTANSDAGEPRPGIKPEAEPAPLPVERSRFESDLATLVNYQGLILAGRAVTPLKLSDWGAIYPRSGGAFFLEGLRKFRIGNRAAALKLLNEAISRNDHDLDFRSVADELRRGGQKKGR